MATHVVVLGGGFGGVHVARRLERLLAPGGDIELTLVNRENFFLVTPLLFEACWGSLELRHCSVPIRAFLKRTRFIEARVQGVDLERRSVSIEHGGVTRELPYDELVLALGAWTNERIIPGSEHALTFKTLADAITLRNHVIERLERAEQELEPARRRALLTFVIIGGGLVGTELLGEITAFADRVMPLYSRVRRDEARFLLLEHAGEIMPEVEPGLVRYARAELERRPGVTIRTSATVTQIAPGMVAIGDEQILAETVVLTAGIVPNPVVAALELERDRAGHAVTDGKLHTSRPGVWALGDCASVPGPDGKPYPYLAQHALREASVLARNIAAVMRGGEPLAFAYRTLGVMASLGHGRAVARILGVRLRGFLAWWLRRTYYLLQTPGFERKLRIVVDWTLALFLRPDIVKVDTDVERTARAEVLPARRDVAA